MLGEDDAPCEVIPGRLTISSLAVAERVLSSGAYTCVVSIGCPTPYTTPADLSRLELPIPKDLPETLLLASLSQTTAYLREHLSRPDRHALVHCVYGQSRSAAVVLAYLISLWNRPDSSAEEIMTTVLLQLRSARPVICINPGFLAQLYLAAMSGPDAVAGRGNIPIARLVKQTEWRAVYGVTPVSLDAFLPDIPGSVLLRCRACSSSLCSMVDVVTRKENREIEEFVKEHTDGFWAGYRPKYESNSKQKRKGGLKGDTSLVPVPVSAQLEAASEDYVVVCWQAWMVSQVGHNSCAPLVCPNARCGVPVGRYSAQGMPICGGFFSVDHIVLQNSAVRGLECAKR
jgi:hypothetical protein